ncbi:DUF779 domain-containing protein [Epibacterium sp. SM1979]|uniref:DUF779 domain-containing protein n=1 Tax=Tritonibacter litoralis TaxID=2662264 RepID=A0A843YMY7_9RHOB|nr:DUF779 domain-containing protein [Tritonibacter litoralis]MQQ10599.1 DUF779 domain-containing protein [Tritonibacter litoralis]
MTPELTEASPIAETVQVPSLSVEATPQALSLIQQLSDDHGQLMFHQSGGCCDGSAPMCYPAGEFRTGNQDVLLGHIGGCPFYIGAAQFELWKHTRLTIDVVEGRGSGFSLEAPTGFRFLTRSSVCEIGGPSND